MMKRVPVMVVLGCLSWVSASAATITFGTYKLHNHPDGGAAAPFYGLRLDELVDVTGGHDIFTFDFDHAGSDVQLVYSPGRIEISGQAWGGLDTGSDYSGAPYEGLYTFSFTYDVGVGGVPGDDDVWADGDAENFGMISGPAGISVVLTDTAMGGYSFRLGDEDDDLGHRGYDGISGWGWTSYVVAGEPHHVSASDWLFTAERVEIPVPEPGTMTLMGLGLAALVARRRQRRP